VLEAVITFEASSKWSDDLEAIGSLKTAFYAHMAESLARHSKLACKVNRAWLRVFSDGFAFQFTIAHPRELEILKKEKPEEAPKCELDQVMRPLHSRMAHGLHMKHPTYGPTVRLALRWLHAHLFSGKFQPEMIELMVASLFVSPSPYVMPVSPTAGFIRFLKLLVTFDWENSALVVDINSELTSDDIAGIRKEVDGMVESGKKKELPVFIVTAKDREHSQWTRGLSSQIWNRIVTYAKKSIGMLDQVPAGQPSIFADSISAKIVFQNELTDFDTIIHLSRSAIPNWAQALHGSSKPPARGKLSLSQYKNLQINLDGLLVGFDPVKKYVQLLDETFGDLAMFFYDQLGGDIVAVVWKPAAFLPCPFRVTEVHNRIPIEVSQLDKVQTVPNIVSILADCQSLGKGLVERIENL